MSHGGDDNQVEVEPVEDKVGDSLDSERLCHETHMQDENQLSL